MGNQDKSRQIEELLHGGDAFAREDEADDSVFYQRDRFVNHLDTLALATVERLVESLIIEPRPVILDLMASWDSHILPAVEPEEVIGLGLNENELSRNTALTRLVLHDLNKEARLPFQDNQFDVVLNTASVDYLIRPFEVFREVGRILKPGGLFLVMFSNRMFPSKAVKIWRHSSEQEKLMLVEDYFNATGLFRQPKIYISKGRPRPAS